MHYSSPTDVILQLFRAGLLNIAPTSSQLLNTTRGPKILWHEKNAYLRSSTQRKIIPLLKKLVLDEKIDADYIVGSPVGGIPWASLLAQEIHVPVCIEKNGTFYTFPEFYSLNLNQVQGCDCVASNIFGLPMAAYTLRDIEKNLLYIKQMHDNVGSFMLEGVWQSGNSVCLYEAYVLGEKPETASYAKLLKKCGLQVVHGSGSPKCTAVSLEGKKVLIIDDIFSSGTSTLDIKSKLVKAKAKVTDIVCLFNQQSESGKKAAQSAGVHVHSIINTKLIIETAVTEGKIPYDEKNLYMEGLIHKELMYVE